MTRSVFEKVMAAWLLVALACASLNSKAMGLAWLVWVLTALGLGCIYFQQVRQQAPSMWARAWLALACAVLLLKTIPMLYWADPWSARHGELRLILGAMAMVVIAQSGFFSALQFRVRLAHVLSWTSAIALIGVIAWGREGVPSHPIPWAASMAMVSAWLLAMALKSEAAPPLRGLWLAGGLCAVLAVLTSQSRGAYGIVLWWVGVCAVHLYRQWRRPAQGPAQASARALRSWPLAVLALACVGWGISHTPIAQRPLAAIQAGMDEWTSSRESAVRGANTSVGARIYMWGKSLEAIQASPWIGHGQKGRKQWIADWAEEADSSEVRKLSHVHNEYLNQWIDHGLFGLASQLCLLIGLFWICRRLRRAQEHTAALALGGIAFVHMTGSLSNVNFGHDYYTACFSLMAGLSLLLVQPHFKAGAPARSGQSSHPA